MPADNEPMEVTANHSERRREAPQRKAQGSADSDRHRAAHARDQHSLFRLLRHSSVEESTSASPPTSAATTQGQRHERCPARKEAMKLHSNSTKAGQALVLSKFTAQEGDFDQQHGRKMRRSRCKVGILANAITVLTLTALCAAPRLVQAHETSWARPATGLVLSIDRIRDTIVFLPDRGSGERWVMDLESSAQYRENSKSVSSLALKPGMRVEVFYRTPIFGNRFIAKVIWNRDGIASNITAAERDSGTAADTGEQSGTVSGLWAVIHQHFEVLGNSIEAERLTEVPAATACVRAFTTALACLRPAPRNRHAKLSRHIALVAQWTHQMESAAVNADQARVEGSYKKLKKALRAIASLYPPEMLKHSTAPESNSAMETQQQSAP